MLIESKKRGGCEVFSADGVVNMLQLVGLALFIVCIPEAQRLTHWAVDIARGATPRRLGFIELQYYLLLIGVVFLTVFINTMLPSRVNYAPSADSWYAVWYSYGGLLMVLAAPVLLLLGGRAYQAAVRESQEQAKRQATRAGLYFGLVALFLWASCYLQLLSKAT